jgi:hypothetical protein
VKKKQQHQSRASHRGILLTMFAAETWSYPGGFCPEIQTHFGDKVFKAIIPRNVPSQRSTFAWPSITPITKPRSALPRRRVLEISGIGRKS